MNNLFIFRPIEEHSIALYNGVVHTDQHGEKLVPVADNSVWQETPRLNGLAAISNSRVDLHIKNTRFVV